MNDLAPALRALLGRNRLVFVGAGVLTAAFIVLPAVVIAGTSLTANTFLSFPPNGVSTRWYSELGTDPIWRDSAWMSLRISFLAAFVACVCGVCAALGLRRARPGVARALRSLFILPLVVPHIVLALGMFNVLNELPPMPSFWPLVLGQAALAFPFALMFVSANLATIDPVLERAAAALGSAPGRVILRIDLPLVKGAIVAAWILAFVFAFDEVVLALFLATPSEQTLPVTIWTAIRDFISPVVAAAAVCVIAFAIGLSVLTRALMGGRSRARRVGGVPKGAPARQDTDVVAAP